MTRPGFAQQNEGAAPADTRARFSDFFLEEVKRRASISALIGGLVCMRHAPRSEEITPEILPNAVQGDPGGQGGRTPKQGAFL